MTALLLLAAGLLIIATRSKGPGPSLLPPEQQGVIEMRDGHKHYKAAIAKLIVNRLVAFRALPTGQDNLLLLAPDPQGLAVGSDDGGAYFAIAGLHAQGFDIWVPTNFHIPTATPGPAMFLPPGETPTLASDTFAMLIAASQPWPPPPTA